MIFSKKDTKPEDEAVEQTLAPVPKESTILVAGDEESVAGILSGSGGHIGDLEVRGFEQGNQQAIGSCTAFVSVFQSNEHRSKHLDDVIAVRKQRGDGTPTCIVACKPQDLIDLGAWLHERAVSETLEGVRLLVAETPTEIVSQLPELLEPVTEQNVIKMPISPEVPDSDFKYFYTISPSLREVVRLTRELAENGVTRLYLLGGPGAGKTSIAYYYWLSRAKGNFITVNLNAESTGDKAAMKSLLCGHVTGAFPGASAREGALSFAKDGVCFLDESHGVTGVVMQVLMEVLDSNQYYPYGATAKRLLECAVLFASNRSWQSLRDQINLDEHARLGATLVKIEDLQYRREDLIAVFAAMFAKFSKQCTTWAAPRGVTSAGWELISSCPWRGNLRTLMRVFETAAVYKASQRANEGGELLDTPELEYGLSLWEPEEHHSHAIYTSVEGGMTL